MGRDDGFCVVPAYGWIQSHNTFLQKTLNMPDSRYFLEKMETIRY